jgi:hypothetical protein
MRDITGVWTLFNAFNSGIPSNYTEALAIDTLGRAWVGTYFGGVGVYDEAKTTTPFVFTLLANTTGVTTANAAGEITHDGGAPVTSRGFVWDTIPSPTLAQNSGGLTSGNGAGTFNANLAGLQSGTLYYLRAFAVNSAGTAYSNTLTFTTLHIGIAEPSAAIMIHLFPNPCTHYLFLETSRPVATVHWLDLSGRLMQQQKLMGTGTLTLSTLGITPGIYLLQVQFDDGEVVRKKVVIEG